MKNLFAFLAVAFLLLMGAGKLKAQTSPWFQSTDSTISPLGNFGIWIPSRTSILGPLSISNFSATSITTDLLTVKDNGGGTTNGIHLSDLTGTSGFIYDPGRNFNRMVFDEYVSYYENGWFLYNTSTNSPALQVIGTPGSYCEFIYNASALATANGTFQYQYYANQKNVIGVVNGSAKEFSVDSLGAVSSNARIYSTTKSFSGTGGTLDWSKSNVFQDSLTANSTVNFANAVDGQAVTVAVTNTGSFTVSFSGVLWPGGTAPIQSANATDVYSFIDIRGVIYGSVNQNY